MGFGIALPFSNVLKSVTLGQYLKLYKRNGYSASFGMSIKYGLNLGALTLRNMEII